MTNDHQKCLRSKTPISLPLSFPYKDERLEFVEHVLDVLSESRTGRRRIYRISDVGWPEWISEVDLPDSFYDLTERIRTHASRFLSIAGSGRRQLDRVVMAGVTAEETGSTTAGRSPAQLSFAFPEFPAFLPLARGSP